MTAPATAEQAAPGNRLPLLLGIGVAAILGMFVLSKVMGGGASPSPETTTAVPDPAPVAPATTVPPPPQPPETFEVFTTKNPFVPLRSTATGGSTATFASPDEANGRTSPGQSTTATGPAPTTGRQEGDAVVPGRSATEPRRGERVALLDVFGEKGRTVANVQVNDTVHKVGAGDVFATSFKVISLSQADGCGRFLFGDDQFRLCKGEEVLK